MTLSQLAQLGEFIGGVAVLATLVYLAVQIRQNTAAFLTSSTAQAAEPIYRMAEPLFHDGEFADIVQRGIAGLEHLTPEERFRFRNWASMMLYGYENLLRAYESGQTTRDALYNAIDNATPYWRGGVVEIARHRNGPTSRRLVETIDARLADLRERGEIPKG